MKVRKRRNLLRASSVYALTYCINYVTKIVNSPYLVARGASKCYRFLSIYRNVLPKIPIGDLFLDTLLIEALLAILFGF